MSDSLKGSILTPTNKLTWIERAWKSVRSQTHQNWEWIVALNAAAKDNTDVVRQMVGDEPRVRVVVVPDSPNVGTLKKSAAAHASGDFLVELDHDDELASTCLDELAKAYQQYPDAAMVYSETASVNADGSPRMYDPIWGWTYHKAFFNLDLVVAARTPPALPQNIARIWYSPDHVRSWRKTCYDQVGGHKDMSICDDVELTCKLGARFGRPLLIPKVLYRYFVHNENTFLVRNAQIQTTAWDVYRQYIEPLALKFSNGMAFDLGAMKGPVGGWRTVDILPGAEIVTDLNERWPWDDDSVEAFRAHDVIEHLRNPIHVMNEAWRCLRHGGLFLIEVPSTDGRGAFQDPTHVSFYNANSFWYYSNPAQRRFIEPAIMAKFAAVLVEDHYPSAWHKQHNILYTRAHLAAIKDGPRLHGGQLL